MKSNKIYLIIICILVIAILVLTFFFIRVKNSRDEYLNTLLQANRMITNYLKAVEDADYSFEVQEDGSFKLVDKIIIDLNGVDNVDE